MRLTSLLVLGMISCDGPADTAPVDGDADTDADTDGDTDADTDPDTDAEPQQVVLSYTGTVVTVTGTPWGLDPADVRGGAATGTFTYDLRVADGDLEDQAAGWYDHRGSGGFELAVAGHAVTGSGSSITEVQDGESGDTWRFVDGPQFGDDTPREMQVDGAAAPAVELWVSLSAPETFLAGDAQPEPFPATDFAGFDFPHTFSLDLPDGRLLMQLDALEQTSP